MNKIGIKYIAKGSLLTICGAASMGGIFVVVKNNPTLVPLYGLPCTLIGLGKYCFDQAFEESDKVKKKCL